MEAFEWLEPTNDIVLKPKIMRFAVNNTKSCCWWNQSELSVVASENEKTEKGLKTQTWTKENQK